MSSLPSTQPAASQEATLRAEPAGAATEAPTLTPVARRRRPLVKKAVAAAASASAAPASPPPVKVAKAGKPAKTASASRATKPAKPDKRAKPAKRVDPVTPLKPAKPAAPARAAAAPVSASEPGKPARIKEKLVRDSFTMPRADFALIQQLKDRMLVLQRHTRKSELLRAGLHALGRLGDAPLRRLLDSLPALKAGRPRKAG